jgi:hypothetical protein
MFSCTPGQLYEENAEILRIMSIYDRGNPQKDEGGEGDGQ